MPTVPPKVDRGYVVVQADRDGRKWVRICQSLSARPPRRPRGVFAMYKRWRNVQVQGVPVEGDERHFWTNEIAEVSLDLQTDTVIIKGVTAM